MGLPDKVINIFYKSATGSRKIQILLTPVGPIFLLTIIVLFIFLSLGIDHRFGFPKLLCSPSNLIISLPFMVIGFFLILWSNWHFLKVKGTPVPFNPPPQLVTTGPYAYVRNPMITGAFILLVGFGLFLNSLSFLFIFCPFLILFGIWELKAIEEPELEKRLGEKYIEYKKKVPMFIPQLKNKKVR